MGIRNISFKYIKLIVNKLGIDIVAYRPTKIKNPFNVLEFVIPYYLASNEPFSFVQIGANNGIRWDPLHDLILKYHLDGLLVEPLPDMFEQLKKNYASESQLSFENVAIATENGTRTLFRVKPNANVPDYAHGLASFNKTLLEGFNQFIQEIQVPTLTIGALLQKNKINHITLLQVDTEGYDYEIIKMFFHERVLPEIINYENINLSKNDDLKCRRLLIDNDYRFIDLEIDTLAIRGGSPAH
jgi:FkbM family methyltransferase